MMIMMYYKSLKSPGRRCGTHIATCAEVELRVQYTATCVDEGWNSGHYLFVWNEAKLV